MDSSINLSAGRGVSYNCTPRRPCRICGKPDYCDYIEFPNGDILNYCHRESGAVGDVKAFSGGLYVLKRIKDMGDYGEFYVWESQEQYEKNREEYRRAMGNTRQYRPKGGTASPLPVNKQKVYKGVVDPLPPKELDKYYRTLFNMLVLETKHRRVLENEWGKVPGLTDRILNTYPVKSLPPYDYVRYSTEEKFDNRKSRKRIIAELVEALGEPRGVRGFYKKENGAWELACKGGILYPEIDASGYICGLRYADDYADVKADDGIYEYGIFEKEQPAGWFFTPSGGERYRVWTFGSKANKITLDAKGYPDVPGKKIEGKYKAVSSERLQRVAETDIEVIWQNRYLEGCRHVTRPSLYTKDGDNCKAVFVTEGEKKAMVSNMLLGSPTISVPGVGSIKTLFNSEDGSGILKQLRERGMSMIVICLDADKATNALVLRAEEAGVREALKAGYRIAVGEWNGLWGKGLDDTLLSGVKPKIYPVQ